MGHQSRLLPVFNFLFSDNIAAVGLYIMVLVLFLVFGPLWAVSPCKPMKPMIGRRASSWSLPISVYQSMACGCQAFRVPASRSSQLDPTWTAGTAYLGMPSRYSRLHWSVLRRRVHIRCTDVLALLWRHGLFGPRVLYKTNLYILVRQCRHWQ